MKPHLTHKMRLFQYKNAVLTGAVALFACALAGCYNNPNITLRSPGEGPKDYMTRPSVGPGTVPGGSTAGPQPQKQPHGGTVKPTSGGGREAEGGLEHAQPATPATTPDAQTPKTGTAQTGNEQSGPGRGPETTPK